jgi:hypothetical protein
LTCGRGYKFFFLIKLPNKLDNVAYVSFSCYEFLVLEQQLMLPVHKH